MENNTGKKNTVKNPVCAAVYVLFAAWFVASMFLPFLHSGKISVSFSDLWSLEVCAEQYNAVLGGVCAFLTAAAAVALAALNITLSVGKGGKKAKTAKLVVLAFCAAVFFAGYTSAVSTQVHFSGFYAEKVLTAAYFFNIVLPIAFLAFAVYDNLEGMAGVFKVKNVRKLFPTTFVYPLIIVLAVVTFILPVYSYTMSLDPVSVTFAKTLSLYGFNDISALLNHRTALITIFCAVMATAIMLTDCAIVSADENGMAKRQDALKIVRIVLCVVYAVAFVFCFPSVMNFIQQCGQDIAGFETTSEVLSVGKNFSYYAVLIVSHLALLAAAADGIDEFVRLGEKKVSSGRNRVRKRRLASADLLFLALYTAMVLVLVVALAVPFATHSAQSTSGEKLFTYIWAYGGVDESGYINGIPTTSYLFAYVVGILAIGVLSAAFLAVCKKLSFKNSDRVLMASKIVFVVLYTVLFALMYWLPGYTRESFLGANIPGSELSFSIGGDLIMVASIGLLVVIWLDFLLCVYRECRKIR